MMGIVNFIDKDQTAAAAAKVCTGEVADIVRLVGKIVMVFQVAIPIILVVVGLVSLGKAVVAGKDDETKKAVSGLVKKLIFAAAIFFVIAIVKLVLTLLPGQGEGMDTCWDLINKPFSEKVDEDSCTGDDC